MKVSPIFARVFHPTFLEVKDKKVEQPKQQPVPTDLSPDLFIKQTIENPKLAVYKL